MKNNIIQTAVERFRQAGIKSVSIDDICRDLGMSKKTFYQYFETKDRLVEEMLMRHEQVVRDCYAAHKENHTTALDVMLHYLEQANKMKDVRSVPPLLYDLRKYYPQLMDAHTLALARINKDYMLEVLRQGVEEGDLRADLDIEMCALLFAELNQQAFNNLNRLGQMTDFPRLSIFTVDLLIRGIVSEQGREKLK